jgi:hypothetical protein
VIEVAPDGYIYYRVQEDAIALWGLPTLRTGGDADKRWVVAGACQNTGVEVSRRRSNGRPLDMFNAAIMGLKRSCKRVPATSRL